MSTTKLDLRTLQQAVTGSAAAFRCRRRLQPAGGPGDKVFPPTFAGAVYAVEQRRVFGEDGQPLPEPKTCVVLDTVQSQANRNTTALDQLCPTVLVFEKSLPAHDAGLRDLYRRITPLLPPPEMPRRAVGFHVTD